MTNTFKGTPWHVAETAPECPWVEVHGVNGLVICDAYDKPTGFLFAAAPDLLESLQDAIEDCSLSMSSFTMEKCLAAIAKATGCTNDA